MEVADHESRSHWTMASKSTVPNDARYTFLSGPGSGKDSPADYEIGNLKSRLAKLRSL